MSCTPPPQIVQISLNSFPPPGLIYIEPRREDDTYYSSVLRVSATDYVPVLIQERALPDFPCPCGKPLTATTPAAPAPPPAPESRSQLEELAERDAASTAFFLGQGTDGCYADDGSGSELQDTDGETADSFHVIDACGRLHDLAAGLDANEQLERYQGLIAEVRAQGEAIERARYNFRRHRALRPRGALPCGGGPAASRISLQGDSRRG